MRAAFLDAVAGGQAVWRGAGAAPRRASGTPRATGPTHVVLQNIVNFLVRLVFKRRADRVNLAAFQKFRALPLTG